ncbi:hypothetical protein [Blastopirellula retiformator]|uniref:Uncharacterized protein n=1 Tax=Blastopirellula retiformator TaxID=2527970 RepID=A0A5C5UXE6_9BACT|nr:hypothetical protein [Blastopirellula retiformator]TWT30075.1 hypothetical protein Enr8_47320 [Blastopirellula retiformator]
MPIPERFRLPKPTPQQLAELGELCDQIEDALESGDDASSLLARWHARTSRKCETHEFTNYWKTTDKEQFVLSAWVPEPLLVEDLTYREAADVIEVLTTTGFDEEHQSEYYVSWLETQFPNANICDLVFWPDIWFGDASLFRDENGAFKPDLQLSCDQILAYAMEKSGRKLEDRPRDVSLPLPHPT